MKREVLAVSMHDPAKLIFFSLLTSVVSTRPPQYYVDLYTVGTGWGALEPISGPKCLKSILFRDGERKVWMLKKVGGSLGNNQILPKAPPNVHCPECFFFFRTLVVSSEHLVQRWPHPLLFMDQHHKLMSPVLILGHTHNFLQSPNYYNIGLCFWD